jgi:hypothetical protein
VRQLHILTPIKRHLRNLQRVSGEVAGKQESVPIAIEGGTLCLELEQRVGEGFVVCLDTDPQAKKAIACFGVSVDVKQKTRLIAKDGPAPASCFVCDIADPRMLPEVEKNLQAVDRYYVQRA